MRITCRIDCSPNEFRRFCGEPDLCPLIQVLASLVDGWLKSRIEALDPNTLADAGTRSHNAPKSHG